MKYNPQEEIQRLDMPILIVSGDADLQVLVSEAEKLHEAQPKAALRIIEGMNHIFRKVEGDDIDNSKTYNNPTLPIMPELVDILTDFITQ